MYGQTANSYREVGARGQELMSRYSKLKAEHNAALEKIQTSTKYDNLLPDKKDELIAIDEAAVRDTYLNKFTTFLQSLTDEQQKSLDAMATKKYPLSSARDQNSRSLGEAQTHNAGMYLSAPRTEQQLLNQLDRSMQLGNIDYFNALVEELKTSSKMNSEFSQKVNERVNAFNEANGISELQNQAEDISKIIPSVKSYVDFLNGNVSGAEMRIMTAYKN